MAPIKALFIINPISGGKDKGDIKKLIIKELTKDKFNVSIVETEYAGHAKELSSWGVDEEFDLIVAVGGDGTLNEVAGSLVGTKVYFGLIPFGSGNGLARHLGIPLNKRKAVKMLKDMHAIRMDTGILNDRPFFNMAGMGLDAKISLAFLENKERGLKNYIKLAFNELVAWKGPEFSIEVDSKIFREKAYMVSIANSTQYGNDMRIAPDAQINDGLLDVCIIRPFPKWLLPYTGFLMYFNLVRHSKYLTVIQGSKIKITQEGAYYAHVDGEPLRGEGFVEIAVNPSSLLIITPKPRI